MNVGDTIQFFDAEECVDYMMELASMNIITDFLYKKDGEKGLWLKIIEVKDNERID